MTKTLRTFLKREKRRMQSAWEHHWHLRQQVLRYAKLDGREGKRLVDADKWMADYAANWRRTNKESELRDILELFTWYNLQ